MNNVDAVHVFRLLNAILKFYDVSQASITLVTIISSIISWFRRLSFSFPFILDKLWIQPCVSFPTSGIDVWRTANGSKRKDSDQGTNHRLARLVIFGSLSDLSFTIPLLPWHWLSEMIDFLRWVCPTTLITYFDVEVLVDEPSLVSIITFCQFSM